MPIKENLAELKILLPPQVTLVAVSKTYPEADILQAYQAGQRIFGENRPQELVAKKALLPADIQWHMIGNLQTNKVRSLVPFVSLIHSVDSEKLLEVIDREAERYDRVIDVLLEVHIAREQSKHGWSEDDLLHYLAQASYPTLTHVRLRGLMGVASYTDDQAVVQAEFEGLAALHKLLHERFFGPDFDTLSMGMSGDFPLAIRCGSTMVRVGSSIFGARTYNK